MSDVVGQKIASLQRCIARARQELAQAGDRFPADHTAQDAALLNVIRACETAIDLANKLDRKQHAGIPSETRESFAILSREKLVLEDLSVRMQKMVGFRNLAVHRYRELDMNIVVAVIRDRLDDLLQFAETVRPLLEERDA
ncbi:MAG TPA: DUF86 domain-containing protein [Gammaproteobacteria bacterium]|nr:DUF86 domain-containing protein [Gammaproteobacteria bacterium]